MSQPAPIRIASGPISAEISPYGAELQRLQDAEGRDLLWDGDPAFWTGRAPILFPVVGVVNAGVIHVDGQAYPMPKHGFARHSLFEVVVQQSDRVVFRLEASEETRAAYPFEFQLDIDFTCARNRLQMLAELKNVGDVPLPASFGFHPALRWPLPYGGAREDHIVRFAQNEPRPIRRIDGDGLLRPEPEPTPVEGASFAVRDALFEDDALIFDAITSRSLRFGAPGTQALYIDFPIMPLLGIWTKPGAGYLCIEPWQGVADPEGYAGEFRDKPGVVEIAPGATKPFVMHITLEEAPLPE
ncbi:aldose 1-epimerase family protein [Sphingomonas nostoxanthinifaciens]|uniref:aldose 1-epimerase family protein n=1 Tax=Sphingomonas nostoxanthinifaciens TaxID=2872652 RepID=UPI001CC1D364|nr:aldose 1-epimerase family protein [Sphingomonas nostoxanthinifaciens]UAK24389.1 aldose 1-epimerase family protein [Sphingomonas nostoxanthinifaciens]